jgi:hypothetical protein
MVANCDNVNFVDACGDIYSFKVHAVSVKEAVTLRNHL